MGLELERARYLQQPDADRHDFGCATDPDYEPRASHYTPSLTIANKFTNADIRLDFELPSNEQYAPIVSDLPGGGLRHPKATPSSMLEMPCLVWVR